MLLRFGYVAICTRLAASPSRTITVKQYERLPEESRFPHLRRLAAENLATTLRILRFNAAYHVRLYRFTSKLIPLATHPLIAGWPYLDDLREELAEVGACVRERDLRVSAHPDHFTVINSPSETVFQDSAADLAHQAALFAGMGLDRQAKMIVHVGGAYRSEGRADQTDPLAPALARFAANFRRLPENVRERLVVENDDRSFTAGQVLALARELSIPVCLDLHHFRVHHAAEETLSGLLPEVFATWRDLPPKVHVSSPQSDRLPRNHADYVDPADLEEFLAALGSLERPPGTVDLMVEAKMKDAALFRLVAELAARPGIRRVDEANLELSPG